MAARPHLCLVVIGTRHDLVAVGREVKRKHLLDMALHGPNVAPGAAVPQSPFKQGARMCVGGWGVGGWNTFESKRMCISMRTVKSHSRPSRSVYTCLGWNTFKMCMEVCVHEQMYTQACVCVCTCALRRTALPSPMQPTHWVSQAGSWKGKHTCLHKMPLKRGQRSPVAIAPAGMSARVHWERSNQEGSGVRNSSSFHDLFCNTNFFTCLRLSCHTRGNQRNAT